jgi:hypothetical protein
MKLKEFIFDIIIYKRKVLGTSEGYVYKIKFQRRGFPHAHILLWLHQDDKPMTTDDYDRLVADEIPDPTTQPLLFATVQSNMMLGPCGVLNPNFPSMDKDTNRCTKGCPKSFQDVTGQNNDGYP